VSILDIQRRQRELGRIRMGDKAASGHPQKLSHFRLTSPARHLLEHAAALWGGEVRQWEGSPSEGQWELYTKTDVLPILIPPAPDTVSQWYEQWTAGGCTHRCDGATNIAPDDPVPCSCDPDDRACKATTRVNVMLPDLPDVGRWRLESHGLNAAYELPGTIDVIQMASSEGRFLAGRLRIEHRTRKTNGQTRKFIVPVIDLDVTVAQLMGGKEGPRTNQPGLGAVSTPEGYLSPPPAPTGEGSTGPSLPAGSEGSGDPSVSADAAGGGSGPGAAPPAEAFDERIITRGQLDRLWAKVGDRGVSEETLRRILIDVTGEASTKKLQRGHYDEVIDRIDQAGQQELGT
jgi:hypothetical protein